jgi:hypothetical protein
MCGVVKPVDKDSHPYGHVWGAAIPKPRVGGRLRVGVDEAWELCSSMYHFCLHFSFILHLVTAMVSFMF